MVPYVSMMTVMHVLLFVLHVCVLRECEGARVMVMLVWVRWMCGCSELLTGSRRGGWC